MKPGTKYADHTFLVASDTHFLHASQAMRQEWQVITALLPF